LLAKGRERALGAKGGNGAAEVLAVGDEEVVDHEPVFFGEDVAEFEFGFIRGFCFHVAPTVRDAMDVDVDTNRGESPAMGDDEVGGLSPNPFKGNEFFDCFWDLSVEIFQEYFAYFLDVLGLDFIKSYGINQFLNPWGAEFEDFLTGIGNFKKAKCGVASGFILGAEAQDRGDEDLKSDFVSGGLCISGSSPYLCHHRGLHALGFLLQDSNGLINGEGHLVLEGISDYLLLALFKYNTSII